MTPIVLPAQIAGIRLADDQGSCYYHAIRRAERLLTP